MSLDELRAAAPHVGFVVYAWAGEPVTLELHFGNDVYHPVRAWTEGQAVAQAARLLGVAPTQAPSAPTPPAPEPEQEDVFA
jgi:hypothetical protein